MSALLLDATNLTRQEWKTLPIEKKMEFPELDGPCPFHSNYHFCALIQKIDRGETVPQEIIESYYDASYEQGGSAYLHLKYRKEKEASK